MKFRASDEVGLDRINGMGGDASDRPLNNSAYYYPQACVRLEIRLEDFGDKSANLAKNIFKITTLAKRVSVEINDYTTADKFNLELDYDSFPFDPRSIRACGVVIAIEDMQGLLNADGTPKKISITKDNVCFAGFADEESISFDDNSRTVKLEGRDFTSLLIDRKFYEGNISLDKSVDKVIKKLLSQLEETKDLNVEFRGLKEFPTLANFYSDKTNLSGKKNVKKDQTYWEVIQSIVADAGLIAFMEIDTLVITQPRVLYDKSKAAKFVYGQNLKSLEFSRKLGRKKGFNLVVRCLDIEKKTVIEARIPKEATAEWSKETGISNQEVKIQQVMPVVSTAKSNDSHAQQQQQAVSQTEDKVAEYISFPVRNVSNKNQLIAIGESIYEEMSRQQLEGSFETKEMAIQYEDANGRMTMFNVLKLRVGTPVAIGLAIEDRNAIDRIQSESGIANYLIEKKKFDPRVARSLAQSLTRAGTAFYTKSVHFELSEQGFSCKVEFINFIEVQSGR